MQRMRFFFKLSSIKQFIIDAMSGRANLATKHQVAVMCIFKFRTMCSPTSEPIVAVVMLLARGAMFKWLDRLLAKHEGPGLIPAPSNCFSLLRLKEVKKGSMTNNVFWCFHVDTKTNSSPYHLLAKRNVRAR